MQNMMLLTTISVLTMTTTTMLVVMTVMTMTMMMTITRFWCRSRLKLTTFRLIPVWEEKDWIAAIPKRPKIAAISKRPKCTKWTKWPQEIELGYIGMTTDNLKYKIICVKINSVSLFDWTICTKPCWRRMIFQDYEVLLLIWEWCLHQTCWPLSVSEIEVLPSIFCCPLLRKSGLKAGYPVARTPPDPFLIRSSGKRIL